jgi:serine/threonine protein kinase
MIAKDLSPTDLPGVWIENSVETPLVVMVAICWSSLSVTQRLLPGPLTIPWGLAESFGWYVVTFPDIKPSNILLEGTADGRWDQVTPMLADFGIARAGDDPRATATGPVGVRGTPSFMAPEQVAGGQAEIGPRSDVYALGATLYSLLTGRPPFQAASVIETLDLVRTREPALPRTLVPGLPRDLETIALTCLRKDPRRRYASAGALADDLRRWLDGFPIQARPVSRLEHARRWCLRRPAVASLLAVLALTVASSLVSLLTVWRRSETERSRAENALARAIESDKTTSGAVRDLVGLLASTVQAPQNARARTPRRVFARRTRSHGETATGSRGRHLEPRCDLRP